MTSQHIFHATGIIHNKEIVDAAFYTASLQSTIAHVQYSNTDIIIIIIIIIINDSPGLQHSYVSKMHLDAAEYGHIGQY